MKRKLGFILLTVLVGLLTIGGVADHLKAMQSQRVELAAPAEEGGFLFDESGDRQHYDANISAPVSHVALPEFHAPSAHNTYAGRNDFRSLHNHHSFISFKAGKLLDVHIQMRRVEVLALLPFGFVDPDKAFIRLGRLII